MGDSARYYKVGLQLYTAEGPQIVRDLVASGRQVFLDLKLHDIPNTVAAAVAEACRLRVSMLTVHASGGSKMMRAAVETSRQASPSPLILAVTVLTSLTEHDLETAGVRGTVVDQVSRLAALAISNGCHGVVASAHEAATLRAELGELRPHRFEHVDRQQLIADRRTFDRVEDGIGHQVAFVRGDDRGAANIVNEVGKVAIWIARQNAVHALGVAPQQVEQIGRCIGDTRDDRTR